LGAIGFWLGRKEPGPQAYGLGWLATLAAVTVYLNLGPDRLDLMRPYLFPAYLCQALLASRALIALIRAARRPWMRGLALGLVGGACLGLAVLREPSLDLSRYYFALDNAHGLLDSLPPKALLLCEGDPVIFPIWYVQRVLHERDDVATVGLDVLPMRWVRDDLRRHWPDIQEPVPTHPLGVRSVPSLTEETLALNPQRPLYADFDRFNAKVQGWNLVSRGPDFLCVPKAFGPPLSVSESPAQRHAAWLRLESVPIRGFTRRPMDGDTLKYLVGDLCVRYNELGVESENAGDYALAQSAYQKASRMKPEDPVYAFNLGNTYAELKDPAAAAQAYGRCVETDPNYVNGWYNLGVIQIQMGLLNAARNSLARARRLAPDRADVAQALRQAGGNLMGM
ncbi:MAG: tetratricopeptide repeat protein, partial [bacterium]